jgi:hypothetical protein
MNTVEFRPSHLLNKLYNSELYNFTFNKRPRGLKLQLLMYINSIILILIIFIYNVTGLYYIFPVIVSIINIFLTSIKLVENPEDI